MASYWDEHSEDLPQNSESVEDMIDFVRRLNTGVIPVDFLQAQILFSQNWQLPALSSQSPIAF